MACLMSDVIHRHYIFQTRPTATIADKKKENYSDVMCHMRTKLRFTLLKSVLIALRGNRGKTHRQYESPLYFLDFGLIPEELSYEAPA